MTTNSMWDGFDPVRWRWPEVLRRPPVFHGRPQDLPETLSDARTLTIGLVRSRPDCDRASAYTVAQDIAGEVWAAAVFSGFGHFRTWVIVEDAAEAFEAAGILMLRDDRGGDIDKPAMVSLLDIGTRGPRGGNRTRTHYQTETLAVSGAHLCWLERHLVGALSKEMGTRSAANHAALILQRHLLAMRKIMRNGHAVADDDEMAMARKLDDLRRFGGSRIRQLYDLPTRRGPLPVGRLWQRAGAQFGPGKPDTILSHPFFVQGFQDLDLCLVACERAYERDKKGESQLKKIVQDDGEWLRVNAATAAILTGEESSALALSRFDQWTQLALRYDFDPVPLFPGLYPARHHFAAARLVGQFLRLGAAEIDPPGFWGLNGLARSSFDSILPPAMQAARKELRALVPAQLWDRLNANRDFMTDEEQCGRERPRPRWKHVRMRQSKRTGENQAVTR